MKTLFENKQSIIEDNLNSVLFVSSDVPLLKNLHNAIGGFNSTMLLAHKMSEGFDLLSKTSPNVLVFDARGDVFKKVLKQVTNHLKSVDNKSAVLFVIDDESEQNVAKLHKMSCDYVLFPIDSCTLRERIKNAILVKHLEDRLIFLDALLHERTEELNVLEAKMADVLAS